MEIKEILKITRKRKHLTQQEIAKKLNITRAAYTLYETGKNLPPTQIILNLADIYGVTTDFLLGRYKDEIYFKE